MPRDHQHFIRIALEEAAKSGAEGNAAVGSVIVRGDSILGRGRNLVTSTHDPTAHAETVALRGAGAALAQEDMAGCTLYTTYEPCPMCCGAIMASGLSTLVMGARPEPSESRWGGYTVEKLLSLAGWEQRIEVVTGVLVTECLEIRRQWEAPKAGG